VLRVMPFMFSDVIRAVLLLFFPGATLGSIKVLM
jgi:hypothetical protein